MDKNLRLLELALTHRVVQAGPLCAQEYEMWNDRMLEASKGKNCLLLDREGFPSVMVRFPSIDANTLLANAPCGPHPAFVAGENAYGFLWLAKYPCCRVLFDGHAHFLSLRGVDSAHHIGYDQAMEACRRKGDGWHMMTNAEYACVALACRRNGFEPHGNTRYGTYAFAPEESGVITDFYDHDALKPGRLLTGSGPASWSHDGTDAGMFELNGNVWEWTAGLRIVNGEIQVLAQNDAALPDADMSAASGWWRAIAADGEWLTPAANGSTPGAMRFFWDEMSGCWQIGLNGCPAEEKRQCSFQEIQAQGDVAPIFELLGLLPVGSERRQDCFFACGKGERLAARGGSYIREETSGIFALLLTDGRERVDSDRIGFRLGFLPQ